MCPGCVWTSIFDVEDAPALVREPAAKSNPIFFWIKRWLHVARIVRLGYNVCKCAHVSRRVYYLLISVSSSASCC